MKKLLTVVLCALMVFSSVVSVAPTTALAKSKCSHKKTKWVTLVKADCTQEGKRAKMCTNCGKTLKTVKVKKLPTTLEDRCVKSQPTLPQAKQLGIVLTQTVSTVTKNTTRLNKLDR